MTVRPLRQMNGGANFNEVFFDDVRIPADRMLGEPGDGWRVALTTLMNERVAIGAGHSTEKTSPLALIATHLDLARRRGHQRRSRRPGRAGRPADPLLGARHGGLAHPGGGGRGAGSGSRGFGGQAQRVTPVGAVRPVGLPAGRSRPRRPGPRLTPKRAQASALLLSAPGAGIAGGTNEVMRNILGERVLGLPKEPQVDRDVPFRDLAHN